MKLLWTLLVLASGAAAAAEPCAAEGDIQFICGVEAVEDLLQVGNSRWLLGSGLGAADRPGALVLIDSVARTAEVVYPGRGVQISQDSQRFPTCPSPPDTSRFNAHGITLRSTGSGRYQFLVVNHGGREAIEFFDISTRGARPVLTWVGCVVMPQDTFINSLDTLPDGGFIATQFYTPSKGGMGAILAREITGSLLEWRPGRSVVPIPGTELSGANGIVLSQRGQVMHVAAWGTRDLVRFERRGNMVTRKTVPLDFAPDNVRWTSDGKLLVAGQKFVARREGPATMDGWTIAVFDPQSLALVKKIRDADGTSSLQGVSSALEVGDKIWIGTFRGDRIGYLPNTR